MTEHSSNNNLTEAGGNGAKAKHALERAVTDEDLQPKKRPKLEGTLIKNATGMA